MRSYVTLLIAANMSLLAGAWGLDIRMLGGPGVGVVPLGQTVPFQAIIENNGKELVTLLEITSSCPCVKVLENEPFVEPGKCSVISLEFKPEKEGVSVVDLRVQTDRPEAQPVHLQLTLRAANGERIQRRVLDPLRSISAADLDGLTARNEAVIVDVRSPQEFVSLKIPGALNIPLALIDKFPAPPGKIVVVCGSGLDDYQLQSSLVKSDRKILRGGMRAWARSGRKTDGSLQSASYQSAVIGFEQFVNAEYSRIPIVLVSESVKHGADLGPYPVLLNSLTVTAMADLPKKLKLLQGGEAAYSPILVMTESGGGYQELDKTLPEKFEAPVFYLKGGMAEFKRNIAIQDGADRRTMVLTSGIQNGNDPKDSASRPGGCIPCVPKTAKPD